MDAVLLHALKGWINKVDPLVLGAAIKDGVVHDSIMMHSTFLHAAQDFHCLVEVSFHCIAFYNRGVGNAIWFATIFRHGFHNEEHLIHISNSGLCINKGIARRCVHLHPIVAHLMPQRHSALRLPGGREALNEDGAQNGVGLQGAVFEELHGFIHLVVAHESIEHTSKNDVVGFQASLTLHLIPEVPALVWALQVCICFDDRAISRY
mmetsp:Transcript_94164/g.115288  ORF Transcript_94164/g.115288 Transcript_94164/m.115288 type:complete len:207 (-) Transcript_94164:226-846(-)